MPLRMAFKRRSAVEAPRLKTVQRKERYGVFKRSTGRSTVWTGRDSC